MKTHRLAGDLRVNNQASGKATVAVLNEELGTNFTYKRMASIGCGTWCYMMNGAYTVIGAPTIKEFRNQVNGFLKGFNWKSRDN